MLPELVFVDPRNRSALAAAAFLARYTGHTRSNYAGALRVMFRWFSQYNLEPLDAKRPHLELYSQYLSEERGLSAVSLVHHLGVIAGFYHFATLDEVIDRDPMIGVRRPKLFHDPYREDFLSEDEMTRLVQAAKNSGRPSDQGLLTLMAMMGLRIHEVLNVQINDYSQTVQGFRVLRLVGKGNKPATLPIGPEGLEMLEAARAGRASGPLLLRETSSVRAHVGTPHTYKSARIALNRLATVAGVERRIAPHQFRRGWITAGLNSGVSLRDMQIAARHSDPRSTSRYDRGHLNLEQSAILIMSTRLAGEAA